MNDGQVLPVGGNYVSEDEGTGDWPMLHVGWTTRAARQTCRTGHVHHIAATRGPWMVDLKIKLTYNTKKYKKIWNNDCQCSSQ